MTECRWLVLTLEAPLAAFGGVVIDHVGETRRFPSQSMITGLITNALGARRTERAAHQRLQDRLVFAAAVAPNATVFTDTQNVQLRKTDQGWTTRGEPEGRSGASYGAPHRRLRDHLSDLRARVVLRLCPEQEDPDLDRLAAVLRAPSRPLFIGRKHCLPSSPVVGDEPFVRAPTAFVALQRIGSVFGGEPVPALWPKGEGPIDGASVHRVHRLSDLRNWRTGLHAGGRDVVEGVVEPESQSA